MLCREEAQHSELQKGPESVVWLLRDGSLWRFFPASVVSLCLWLDVMVFYPSKELRTKSLESETSRNPQPKTETQSSQPLTIPHNPYPPEPERLKNP